MKVKEFVEFIPIGDYYVISFECKISKNATIRRVVDYRRNYALCDADNFEQKFLLDCDVKEISACDYDNYDSVVCFILADVVTYYIGVENA